MEVDGQNVQITGATLWLILKLPALVVSKITKKSFQRRKSVIALSKNAFAFRLQQKESKAIIKASHPGITVVKSGRTYPPLVVDTGTSEKIQKYLVICMSRKLKIVCIFPNCR